MDNNTQHAAVHLRSWRGHSATSFMVIQTTCWALVFCAVFFAPRSRAEVASGTAEASVTRHNVALVIGNANYLNAPVLKNPEHDAQDMCDALKALGYTAMCFVNVDTRTHLRAIIEDFVEAVAENGVALVYYAGHAVQVKGENYLIPTAIRPDNEAEVIDQSVSLAFLMGQLRRTSAYLSIVLLDACRDNPLPASDLSRSSGLAQITVVPDNTEILYATAANERAIDGPGRNGILTKYLLLHLKEPGSVDDLFKVVGLDVQRETAELGHSQKPALYTNFTGHYCFLRCTTLQMLQQQKEEAALRIVDLEARVTAGDREAKAELDAAKQANAALTAQIKKKEREEKNTQQRVRVNVPL